MAAAIDEEFSPESESARTVFQQDLLREIILNLAIHQPDHKINREALISLRQVARSWRDTISRLVNQQKLPLYTLKLDENNSVRGNTYVNVHGKRLDTFLDFFENRDEDGTVKLKVCEEFFRLENYESFCRSLRVLSTCLVELEMLIPLKVGSFPGVLPNVGLPNLQKLTLNFSSMQLDDLEFDAPATVCYSYSNTTLLLQSLLQQIPNVKFLVFHINHRDRSLTPPLAMQYLTLPSSIQKLHLTCCMTDLDLNILKRNKLPNLRELHLELTGFPLTSDTFYNALDNFKDTLVELRLHGKGHPQMLLTENMANFPEMKNLKFFTVSGINIVLHKNTRVNLGVRFPKLERLQLITQKPVSLLSWVLDSTNLETVRELCLNAMDIQGDPAVVNTLPSPGQVTRFFRTMPNLTKLTLWVWGSSVANLKLLFPKLEMLRSLKIEVPLQTDQVENSDLWDSLLTGIPQDVIKGIRMNPHFHQHFDIITKQNDTVPSIRMLKSLEMLSLDDKSGSKIRRSLISFMSFKFSLLRMPALQTLELNGRFYIVPSLASLWIKGGRHLIPRQTRAEVPPTSK